MSKLYKFEPGELYRLGYDDKISFLVLGPGRSESTRIVLWLDIGTVNGLSIRNPQDLIKLA